ncbi:ShlB/FhaC/HecB family hemolysin secretion/activation protein [Anaerospora hongkongensis]|uniref:ShlB/FhaC/HecB family hemolysin secretion/activation protein n=1 Tax=Anaerospora hongkongensis TaxID=244830 RepID=UPI0028A17CA2|nr:ShlB/FhaC/HecB family hemolysin secretion/activation protein [Anaerospora hongkongensis]
MQRKIRRNMVKRVIMSLGLICSLWASSLPGMTSAEASEMPAIQTVMVSDISYSGNSKLSNTQVNWLLPELKKGSVNVATLSRQIQIANDSGAAKLSVKFVVDKSGQTTAVVTVKELPNEHTLFRVDNTGNEYTGDYRSSLTYVNTNTSNHADMLGVAYVTSPNHISDVTQAALFYRQILPKAGDSLYFSYSYSDVNMGQIANFGSLSMNATGRGHSYGLHYQHNLNYSVNKRNWLDFGVDYKDYNNAQNFAINGTPILQQGTDFAVTTLGLTYGGSIRDASKVISYSLGYVTNANGNEDKYNTYRTGSDKQFGLFKAGINHQYKMGGAWIGNVRLNGQFTRDNLLTTEQLGAGGMYSVRGFDERAISADNGYIANIEFYTPEIAKGQRFVLFSDIGHLYNNHANIGELKNDTIASVGAGYRYTDTTKGWSGSLDYAYVIDDIENKNDQDSGKWHVSVSKKF